MPRAVAALRAVSAPRVAYVAADTPHAARSLCLAVSTAAATASKHDSGLTCVTMPEQHVAACFGSERRGAACQRIALLELYLLASSSSFLFSEASSFSSIALMLGRGAGSMATARPGCTPLRSGLQQNETLVEGLNTRPVRDVRPWWLA